MSNREWQYLARGDRVRITWPDTAFEKYLATFPDREYRLVRFDRGFAILRDLGGSGGPIRVRCEALEPVKA